ncbi:MAG: DUF222 domain-containing protein [Microthrixaceae bacterium]
MRSEEGNGSNGGGGTTKISVTKANIDGTKRRNGNSIDSSGVGTDGSSPSGSDDCGSSPVAPTDQPRHLGSARPRARAELLDRPVDGLEAEVIELSGRLSAGTYELLVLVGELDLRGRWAAWGALSCAAWLASICDIEVSTARTQVRVARAMRQYPTLDQAMANGDVSYAKARVLVPHLSDDNIGDLLDIAVRTSAGRLGAAVAAWSHRNDDPETIRKRQYEARSVSWRTEPDGMVVITARLTPEAAGALCATIDTVVASNHAPAGASLGQQRADALVKVATAGGAVTAEVVLHVRGDGNTLADGTPLSDHAVGKLLPEAFVSLLMHDSQRQPIDASPRRRFPTRRQRRVLDQIDEECRHPGCHATEFLQYDHDQPYALGGPTILANLRRLCGPHNRDRN